MTLYLPQLAVEVVVLALWWPSEEEYPELSMLLWLWARWLDWLERPSLDVGRLGGAKLTLGVTARAGARTVVGAGVILEGAPNVCVFFQGPMPNRKRKGGWERGGGG